MPDEEILFEKFSRADNYEKFQLLPRILHLYPNTDLSPIVEKVIALAGEADTEEQKNSISKILSLAIVNPVSRSLTLQLFNRSLQENEIELNDEKSFSTGLNWKKESIVMDALLRAVKRDKAVLADLELILKPSMEKVSKRSHYLYASIARSLLILMHGETVEPKPEFISWRKRMEKKIEKQNFGGTVSGRLSRTVRYF